jgi:hypothetical protein
MAMVYLVSGACDGATGNSLRAGTAGGWNIGRRAFTDEGQLHEHDHGSRSHHPNALRQLQAKPMAARRIHFRRT